TRNSSNQIDGLNTTGEFQGKIAAEIASDKFANNIPVASNTSGGLPAVTITLDIKLD
ncbi:14419_t:CDS:2, partial [Funneliformis geosporum]